MDGTGTSTKRINVAIVFPSGVGSEHFSIRMMEGVMRLELTVKWPTPLCDREIMHRKWLTATGPGKMEKLSEMVQARERETVAVEIRRTSDDVVDRV